METSNEGSLPGARSAEVDNIISKLKRKRDDRAEEEEEGRKKKKKNKRKNKKDPRITVETAGNIQCDKKDRKKKNSKISPTHVETTPTTAIQPELGLNQNIPSKKHHKKGKKQRQNPDEEGDPDDVLSKHKSIRQKLSKVKSKALKAPQTPEPTEPTSDLPPITPIGLEPLPQPLPTNAPKHSVTLAASLPPWLASPTVVSPTTTIPFSNIPGISPKLLSRLSALSLPHAFAVQSAVVPLLLTPGPGDVCISAATGSGKTLSYVLPIIQSLCTRVVTRLRAIIVVPTRELVSQVSATASSLTPGTKLKVGTAVGSRALAAEQALLVGAGEDGIESKIDILITTPGRLVEHIGNTPGFSLRWVKWLVIDEADRLLAQSFQGWVDVVVGEVEKVYDEDGANATILEDLGFRVKGLRSEVRKVVLSATMTKDAGKLAGLKLRRPTMVVVESPPKLGETKSQSDGEDNDMPNEIFTVPAELCEYAIPIANTEYKPLHLLYLLRDRAKSGTVIFVKSNEGAARLAVLIDTVVARIPLDKSRWTTGLITGEMEKKRREKMLKSFKRGEIQMIIASDLIARGLDLPHVEHIVNYDVPASTRAYVHRVGRTARAGKEGKAFTLVADKEARWFWRNIGRGIRREQGMERLAVGLEGQGLGWRGVYEAVLYA